MKKIIIVVAIVIVAGVGIYYAVSNTGSKGTPAVYNPVVQPSVLPAPTTSASNIPTAPASSLRTIVSIKNFSFNPSTLIISSGTKVTWVNDDSVSHTITSDSGSLLNSPVLSPGQSFSFTFTSSGSATYHCSIHTTMKGTVVVE